MIVSTDEIWSYLRADQVGDQTFVVGALASAHSIFYDMCAREFELADTVASARSYVPSGSDVLRIHDCAEITTITANGTAVTGYQKEPVGPTWAGEQRPYEQVRLLGSCWFAPSYIAQATIVVTAKWGWAATPPPAVDAVKVLCKDIVTNRDVRAGFVSFGDAGVAAARRNPFILSVVERYGRLEATAGIAG